MVFAPLLRRNDETHGQHAVSIVTFVKGEAAAMPGPRSAKRWGISTSPIASVHRRLRFKITLTRASSVSFDEVVPL